MTRTLILLAVTVVALSLLAVATAFRIPESGVAAEPRLPEFALPQVRDPQRTLRSNDIRGRVSIVNVWATWCVPCRREHGVLMAAARESGVPFYGLNYRDQRDDARRWLESLGDPYLASGFDGEGEVAGALGVHALPETYVIDERGRIVHRHLGAVTDEVWRTRLQPAVDELRGAHR